jgi:hypothetical protein
MAIKQWKWGIPSQVFFTRLVFDMVIKDGLHFSAVEGEGFKELLRNAEPRFQVPSRPYLQHVRIIDLIHLLLRCLPYPFSVLLFCDFFVSRLICSMFMICAKNYRKRICTLAVSLLLTP